MGPRHAADAPYRARAQAASNTGASSQLAGMGRFFSASTFGPPARSLRGGFRAGPRGGA